MRFVPRAARRLPSVGLLGLALFAASAPATAAGPLDKALPETTFFYLEVSNVSQLREAFSQTQFGRLLDDEAMAPLLKDVTDKLEKPSAELKERVGLTIPQVLDLFQGTLTLAVAPSDNEKFPVSVLLAADAGKNAESMRELTKKLLKFAEDDGKVKIADEESAGIKIKVLSNPDDEKAPPIALAEDEGTFFFAAGADSLKDLLKNKGGRDDSLAKSEEYAKARGKVTGSQISAFVNINALIKFGIDVATRQGNANVQQAEAMLQILGINNLKSIAAGIEFAGGQFDSTSKIFVAMPQPAQGILRLFQLPKVSLKPEPWVSANAANYQSISWDLDQAFEALNDLINQFAPGTLGVIEQQIAGAGEPISFQKDIFGPLGDRITSVTSYKQPPKPENQQILIGVALEDSKAFQGTLNKIFKLAGVTPDSREFQGTQVFDFDVPELPGGGIEVKKVSLAIAKDTLFVATAPEVLEAALRGDGPSLADSEEFRKAAAVLPNEVSSLSYAKAQENFRAVYDMIKSGQFDEMLQQAGRGNGPKLSEIIDVEKIPAFEVFAKYLSDSVGYWSMDEDGLTIQGMSLKTATP